MKTINRIFALLLILFSATVFAQEKALVLGVLLDEQGQPVEGVTISYDDNGNKGNTTSNKTGFYKLEIPAGKEIIIFYTHVSYTPASVPITLPVGKKGEINAVLEASGKQIEEIRISSDASRQSIQGMTKISRDVALNLPGANAGIENVLKVLGVNSHNEMSTQYSARGGSYDENLVYVEDIEIYRPFLIRTGQQEGLSFTNTAMVQNVEFSAGGFQAKYGDKMSSVLDITYRRPTRLGLQAEASFLGGSMTVEGISKNQKWSGIIGGRYRDNSLLVNSQQTESNYKPTFTDVQAMVNFSPNSKWEMSFLGNISQNKYNYEPLYRQTNFGTLDAPMALQIFYDGKERDQYTTYFGAFKSTYTVSENFQFKVIGSLYHTIEQEYFDILAQYNLGEVDTNIGSDTFGDIKYARGVGSQLNHARNNLDALIANAEIKGYHVISNSRLEWGVKYTREDIRDRLLEWEVIDSAGFSVRPPIIDLPNDQPYTPYAGPLVPYQNVRATNFTQIDRFSGFVQWSHRTKLGEGDLFINAGVRAQNWKVGGNVEGKAQTTVSPRAQLTFKPAWDMDMLFRLSGGAYNQPPFYRELRDSLGQVRPDVKAQKSIHLVAGNDYSFRLWTRPFKLVSELWYKKMDDVNTYTLENVRMRYRANNDAVAYAYGLDLRMNGEFVPGTESWVTVGYMKTEENLNDRGYIARPTDQRLKFGILFQDYVPNIPNLKVYLNMVYNTGLPGGSPSYADPYLYQSRLNDYRRVDAGFAYVFVDSKSDYPKGHWLSAFRDLSLGLEIFNLFNNQNAITNTWVRDVYTKSQYAIPNYLTSRVFSLKLNVSI